MLRNYLAQKAIEALERGVLLSLHAYGVLKNPYDEQPEHDDLARRRPSGAAQGGLLGTIVQFVASEGMPY